MAMKPTFENTRDGLPVLLFYTEKTGYTCMRFFFSCQIGFQGLVSPELTRSTLKMS